MNVPGPTEHDPHLGPEPPGWAVAVDHTTRVLGKFVLGMAVALAAVLLLGATVSAVQGDWADTARAGGVGAALAGMAAGSWALWRRASSRAGEGPEAPQ